jgi:transposase InsO family protein
MKEPEDDRRFEVALQRYEVISPLLNRPLPRGVQEIMIDEISGILHYDVDGKLISLGKRTIERYLSNYLKFGLEGLKPQVRPEQGSLKSFPQEALDEAIKLRETRPELSADSIIEELRSAGIPGAEQMNVSTLNRHLRRLAKDRPSLKRVVKKRYRLLSVDGAHVLWICDVWDGPYLYDEAAGRKRRLRLVAIIDSFTRLIVHAELYFNENRPCIEDTLMKAILKHHLPAILYVDNAQVFRSQHLLRIAAELGFAVKHSKAGAPEGRGKIERWFRTVAEKCEPLLKEQIDSGKLTALQDVNVFFAAWLERRYHDRRHGTLKMSPRQALARAQENHLDMSRQVEASTVHEAFLWRERREVSSLGAVKIYGNLYEVDEDLLGKTVELRFNPYDLRRILVYSEGVFRCQARPYQMKNFTDKRVSERQADSQNALDQAMQALVREHKDEIRKSSGLSFARALEVKRDE